MIFRRVTFGVSSSPFLLNATIQLHLSSFDSSSVIKELKKNLYADDWLTGADDEEEAVRMLAAARHVMAQAGM